jgi:hypothetical protein
VLPVVLLRLGLPMVHELLRSVASGLIADCRLADAGARLTCHKVQGYVRAISCRQVGKTCPQQLGLYQFL